MPSPTESIVPVQSVIVTDDNTSFKSIGHAFIAFDAISLVHNNNSYLGFCNRAVSALRKPSRNNDYGLSHHAKVACFMVVWEPTAVAHAQAGFPPHTILTEDNYAIVLSYMRENKRRDYVQVVIEKEDRPQEEPAPAYTDSKHAAFMGY